MYKELLEKKKKGIQINLKDLNYEELYQLYIVENIMDREIADLCNCQKKSVSNKRCRLGVYFYNKVLHDFAVAINEEVLR